MSKGSVYIGTSGWQYKHWKGTFYPVELKSRDWFNNYQQTFSTVEINNSFYKLPSPELFKRWKAEADDDFIFSVKANRFITHMKKLKDPEEPLDRLLRSALALGRKLGPILFQLPPRWGLNLERFEIFLQHLPRKKRFVFEFRHPSWYSDGVYAAMQKSNVAFCIYDLAGHQSPMVVTADFVYIRLHGPGEKYQGSYSISALREWNKKIRAWASGGKDVYIYFDNDQEGYAALNAKNLERLYNEAITNLTV
jgi:uncharacterized protein YecE (DUF72 family)